VSIEANSAQKIKKKKEINPAEINTGLNEIKIVFI